MNCAIVQPSYIPWRGFFHLVQKADVFIFFDDVQYTKRSWRSRNRIQLPGGPGWLTIPVSARGSIQDRTPICMIEIDWSTAWDRSHREKIHQAYRSAPYYRRQAGLLDRLYATQPRLLADFTIATTRLLAEHLGLGDRRFLRSSELAVQGSGTERVLSLLRRVSATRLVNGPSARGWTDEPLLRNAGIELEYMTYEYPEYPQLGATFDPQLSILDLLVMTGDAAPRYIWGGD